MLYHPSTILLCFYSHAKSPTRLMAPPFHTRIYEYLDFVHGRRQEEEEEEEASEDNEIFSCKASFSHYLHVLLHMVGRFGGIEMSYCSAFRGYKNWNTNILGQPAAFHSSRSMLYVLWTRSEPLNEMKNGRWTTAKRAKPAKYLLANCSGSKWNEGWVGVSEMHILAFLKYFQIFSYIKNS